MTLSGKIKGPNRRPPIVTIMGHVDHGKTSLLQALIKRTLTAKESGGITQAVSAHSFISGDRRITFVDTPGHEAFLSMRRSASRLADIVLLVVSAEEGVKPQTKEAIEKIKEMKAYPVVVITKMDLPGADPERVKRELAESGVLAEGMGGDVPVCLVSIKNEESLEKLVELIFLVSDLHNFPGDEGGSLEAIVLESILDRRRGPLSLVVVRSGSLKVGDEVSAGSAFGRIRSLTDDHNQPLKVCLPGRACFLMGLSTLAPAGYPLSRGRVESKLSEESSKAGPKKEGEASRLKVVLKADTFGSLEAILHSLPNLPDLPPGTLGGPQVVLAGVGDISESDVYGALESGAVIVGFRVKTFDSARSLASDRGVEIRTYDVIYLLLSELSQAVSGLLAWQKKTAAPKVQILKIFTLPSGDQVLGVKVENGLLKVGQGVAIKRGEQELLKSSIKQLKIGHERVEKISGPSEAGILLKERFDSGYLQAGDVLSVL